MPRVGNTHTTSLLNGLVDFISSHKIMNDEDMASMHMTMLGESHEGQQDQQGLPNREGGPKLIWFESLRWRPKSSSSPSRAPGAVCSKTDVQAAYELRF
jgi:hypothetical protein